MNAVNNRRTCRDVNVVLIIFLFRLIQGETKMLRYSVATCAALSVFADSPNFDIHQLEAFQKSAETAINIHVMWFAFACTINGTVFAFIASSERLRLRSKILPSCMLLGDIAGAIVSGVLCKYYYYCNSEIVRLLPDHMKPYPAIPLTVLMLAGGFMALISLLMGIGWIQVQRHWNEYYQGTGLLPSG